MSIGSRTLVLASLLAAERHELRPRQRWPSGCSDTKACDNSPHSWSGLADHTAASRTAGCQYRTSSTSLAGDVGAAADDQVLLAIDDVEVALGIDGRHVAAECSQPFADGLRGLLRIVPVASHHLGAAEHDLADLAGLDVATIVVDDPQFAAERRPAAAN